MLRTIIEEAAVLVAIALFVATVCLWTVIIGDHVAALRAAASIVQEVVR